MKASMLGLGAVLSTSALLFAALRWLGGAYLIYLGVKLWRAPVGAAGFEAAPAAGPLRMFAHAYAVTALNPKGIIFFVAFVPQFVDASRSFLPQVAALVGTFVTMAALNSLGFALLASAARQRLQSPRVQRAVNRTGGVLRWGPVPSRSDGGVRRGRAYPFQVQLDDPEASSRCHWIRQIVPEPVML